MVTDPDKFFGGLVEYLDDNSAGEAGTLTQLIEGSRLTIGYFSHFAKTGESLTMEKADDIKEDVMLKAFEKHVDLHYG
ncbi:hypothetical protein MZD04_gp347 [Pseudomonas phage Psa21]|uniref:Uncharacterized protein n=1 Tax=Pseudomonas phage Psa21 TaxID=2530023 RepID=A0A481W660_9CAUD|nr:hypothetical protein MZD04_gp347 [Pseudomonas phage Psa21]QBJ02873.1 hypothetical protein PSA21_347 [Pseudomonas phage Psa21]